LAPWRSQHLQQHQSRDAVAGRRVDQRLQAGARRLELPFGKVEFHEIADRRDVPGFGLEHRLEGRSRGCGIALSVQSRAPQHGRIRGAWPLLVEPVDGLQRGIEVTCAANGH
jgi:hypothetical protein